MRRVILGATILLVVACDVVTENYATVRDARVAGADRRGLLPPFLPANAAAVRVAHDTDTGDVWVRCRLSREDVRELRKHVRLVGWGEARAGVKPAPRMFGEWHAVLGGALLYTPEGTSLYFVGGDGDHWHGVVADDGRCWIYESGAV